MMMAGMAATMTQAREKTKTMSQLTKSLQQKKRR